MLFFGVDDERADSNNSARARVWGKVVLASSAL